MILVLADTHSQFFTINEQIDYAENKLGIGITCVIHLGDFGIFRPGLKKFFKKEAQRFTRPLYFVEGNHEDFTLFPWLVKKYEQHFRHLQRSQKHQINEYQFLALGGADYMDAMITQKGAVITESDIKTCLNLQPDEIDIIISHDCPKGIGVPNTAGLEYYGETGFKGSDELKEHFKPRLWLFGHHHKWFDYCDDRTRYVGLPASWQGFGVLGSDYEFRTFENKIPLPPKHTFFDLSRWKQLISKRD